MYLLEKGTRNLTVIETIDLSHLYDSNSLFSNQNSLPVVNHEDQFWYSKILQPKEQKSSSISPLSLATSVSDRTYKVSYSLAGGIVNEEIVIRHLIDGPSEFSGSSGDFITKVYILSQRTWSTNISGLNTSSSNFQVGRLSDTRIDAYTEPGDAFRKIQWDGSYIVAGGFTAGFKIGYSLKAPNINIASYDITYNFSTPYTSKTSKTFDNTGTDKVRTAGAQFKQGMYLKKTMNPNQTSGDTFDVIFQVGNYNTAAKKKLFVKWTYDLSNGQAPYDTVGNGTKTSNQYLVYTSK